MILTCQEVSSWSQSSSDVSQQQTSGSNSGRSNHHLGRREWIQHALSSTPLIASSAWGLSTTPSTALTPKISTTPSSSTNVVPHLTKEYYDAGNVKTMPSAGRTFFPTLTPPFFNRATVRYNLGRNTWALEQLLSFANVTATIRTTVVQLESTGGLWVHSPQWPTGEFMALLDDIGRPVEHLVLPCNALEHKAPMKDVAKRFPSAQVWISPGQYGPFGSCDKTTMEDCNMGYRVDGILGDPNGPVASWADEFDTATLYVNLPENAGPVSEVAFCHRPTSTLIATDAVVYIPSEGPPDIFGTYFDKATMEQDPNFWAKSVLQSVFLPLRGKERPAEAAVEGSSPTVTYYPGFDAIKDRLVRAPILRAFSDARAPKEGLEWINTICSWKFDRIVTSHFASPIAASPTNVREAFGYLENPPALTKLPPITCQDWELLEGLNQVIAKNKLGAIATFDYSKGCLE